jgi:signal transduction histidine kinase/DNA-binding NarL/FixJ family response regulator/HPt (histidine-containing phosphotransfer) domain-containing protein
MMDATLSNFLRQQGYALCEYRGDGNFVLLAEPAPWFAEIWDVPPAEQNPVLRLGDTSPFLQNFLAEAETFWASGGAHELASGDWIETALDGRELPLECLALRVAGKKLLALQSRAAAFAERSRILQTARDGLLVHERLLKEIQKKEILLHCIIHDLSQPLTAMRGCFDCLTLEDASPRTQQLAELGRQQSEQQEEMIREVLKAFSADLQEGLQGGAVARELPEVVRCATETVEAFTPVFRSKGLSIRLDPRLAGHPGWRVKAETTRLKRIFSNLVENALRHAPAGSMVTLGAVEEPPYVKAFVEDEGPGLPKDFLASSAFKLFGKGKEGGKAGLGLYFCRITVERWGGSIGCESVAPKGSRFWFRLPVAKQTAVLHSNPAAISESAKSPAEIVNGKQRAFAKQNLPTLAPSGKPLRILLADDDPAIRELTELLISRQGYSVFAVTNGEDALKALDTYQFDVVLLDDEMPRLSGAETARRLRAQEKDTGRHQFLLSMSGNNTEADKLRLQQAGMDACLSKPFRAEELKALLARLALEKGDAGEKPTESQAASPSQGNAPTSAPGKTPVSSSAVSSNAISPEPDLLARVGGDPKLLRRVIKIFLKDRPKKISNLRRALARRDAPAVAAAAHAIKGPIALFAASSAKAIAEQLQETARQGQLADAPKLLRDLEEEIANLERKLRGYTAQASRARTPSEEHRPSAEAKSPAKVRAKAKRVRAKR